MAILTSRPNTGLTAKQLSEMVDPTIRVLKTVAALIIFEDDTPASVRDAQKIVEDLIDDFKYAHTVVMAAPSGTRYELHYDCAVQPIPGVAHVSFRVIFKVRL